MSDSRLASLTTVPALATLAIATGAAALTIAATRGTTTAATSAIKPPKRVVDSSISYRAKFTPEHCDEHGRVYGGELLKLIDVSAGVVAAKHNGGPTVTISLEYVTRPF